VLLSGIFAGYSHCAAAACYWFLEAIQKKVKRCWKRRDFNGMECADGHEKGSNGGN
jgi:hypothetical protein